jgi:hypothetical protein
MAGSQDETTKRKPRQVMPGLSNERRIGST